MWIQKHSRHFHSLEYSLNVKIRIGVVDIHSDIIESPQKIRDEIMVASKILGDPSLVEINPDCGLRTRKPEIAYAKLQNMVKGADIARKKIRRMSSIDIPRQVIPS